MTDSDEYVKAASEDLARQIDFEVMSTLLLESGWVKVVLRPMTWEQAYEVDTWVEENVKGNVHTMGLVWLFERPKEATWFTIRWL